MSSGHETPWPNERPAPAALPGPPAPVQQTAVAVAPVLMPSATGKTTVAVNTGYYRGEAGVGIGLSQRLNFSLPTLVYGSYSNGGGNEHVGRAGMAVEF